MLWLIHELKTAAARFRQAKRKGWSSKIHLCLRQGAQSKSRSASRSRSTSPTRARRVQGRARHAGLQVHRLRQGAAALGQGTARPRRAGDRRAQRCGRISAQRLATSRLLVAGRRADRDAGGLLAACDGGSPGSFIQEEEKPELLGVPVLGLGADLLIGAGCVAEVAVERCLSRRSGLAPRFSEAAEKGEIVMRDATCPPCTRRCRPREGRALSCL